MFTAFKAMILREFVLKNVGYQHNLLYILVIPQWMVDNNLGPDCIAGPKALDPNYCRQPNL